MSEPTDIQADLVAGRSQVIGLATTIANFAIVHYGAAKLFCRHVEEIDVASLVKTEFCES